ncbi:protein patched-like protein, partial [Dinothrombium tinctorium]
NKATGNRSALWLRDKFQVNFYSLGCFIQRNAGKVLFVGILFLLSMCVGLKSVIVETNVDKLWVEVGGRLEKELDYIRKTLGEGFGNTNQLVIQTPKNLKSNILHPNALLQHLETIRAGINVTVDMFEVTWSLKDVCYSLSVPAFEEYPIDEAIEKLIPCAIITPLDCFWEGSKLLGPEVDIKIPGLGFNPKWTNLNPQFLLQAMESNQDTLKISKFPIETFKELMKRAGITSAYQRKPCLNPKDENCPATAPNKACNCSPNVAAELTGGCYGFATKWMHWPEELIVGGVKRNKSGHIIKANAFQSIIQLMAEQDMFEYWKNHWKVHNIEWSVEKARLVLEAWQRKFSEEVQRVSESHGLEKDFNVFYFTNVSLSDIMKNFSNISPLKVFMVYCLILVYAAVVLANCEDRVNSQSFLGMLGVLLIALSISAGLGFCAIIRLPFNASTTQIIPFLAIGLGMDALFLLSHTYAENVDEEINFEEITGECLKQIGSGILITSFCCVASFGSAAIIPIPALRIFAFQSAILIMLTTASTLLLFPALASLDLRRRRALRMDVLFCFKSVKCEKSATVSPKKYVVHSLARDGNNVLTTVIEPNSAKPEDSSADSLIPLQKQEKDFCKNGSSCEYLSKDSFWSKCSLKSFVTKYYVPVLKKKPAKIIVIFLCLFVLLICLSGVPHVEDGLELTDIVPRKTIEYKFLSVQRHYFSVFNMFAITQGNFDYPNNQKLLYEYHNAFTRVENIIKNDDGGLQDFWLTVFRDWLFGLQSAFDTDWKNGCITQERWYENASVDAILAYKLLVQTGRADNPVDKSLVTKVRLVDEAGIINPKAFYNYLTVWVSNDALAYSASQANFRPEPRNWVHIANDYELKIPKSQPLVYTQIPFFLYNLKTTEEITSTIQEIRSICKKFEDKGLPNFPTGLPFVYWEQYVQLRWYLLASVIFVFAVVFLVVCLFLVNFWAAALIIVVLFIIVSELFGFLGLLKIRLSAVPAVILIISVGIGTSFLMHISLSFLTAIGSKNRRMGMALEHMFSPLTHGIISTMFGVAILAFSEFDFIIRYFFYVLCGLIILVGLNGLLLFPVLLSIIGPPSELTPLDNKNRISTPSPSPSPPIQRRLRNAPSFSRRCYPRVHLSDISLSTIPEESQSYQSSHEIVVQPQLVLETTTITNSTTPHFYSHTTSNVDGEVNLESYIKLAYLGYFILEIQY